MDEATDSVPSRVFIYAILDLNHDRLKKRFAKRLPPAPSRKWALGGTMVGLSSVANIETSTARRELQSSCFQQEYRPSRVLGEHFGGQLYLDEI